MFWDAEQVNTVRNLDVPTCGAASCTCTPVEVHDCLQMLTCCDLTFNTWAQWAWYPMRLHLCFFWARTLIFIMLPSVALLPRLFCRDAPMLWFYTQHIVLSRDAIHDSLAALNTSCFCVPAVNVRLFIVIWGGKAVRSMCVVFTAKQECANLTGKSFTCLMIDQVLRIYIEYVFHFQRY